MATGFSVIRRFPTFRSLWYARTMSYVGDFITLTALVLYLEGIGASPAQVGIALAARALPQVFGPIAGAVVDRLDSRTVLLTCDLGRLVAMGTVALVLPPFPVLVALMTVSSLLSTFFLPASKSATPRLVSSEELGSANALLGMSHNISLAAGPAGGALLFAHFGPEVAFGVDALSYGLSALFLLGLPSLRNRVEPTDGSEPAPGRRTLGHATRDALADTREGLRYVVHHRAARTLAVGLFIGVSLAGLDNVALVFFVRDQLGAGEESVGFASSMYGLAMIVAPIALLRTKRAGGADRLLVLGFALGGVGLILTGVSPFVTLAIACYSIAGVGNGLENVACDTMLGRTVEPEMLGRVFGAVYGPIFLAESLAAALGSFLLTFFLPGTVFIMAGAGLLVLTVAVWFALPRDLERTSRA